MCGCFYQVEKNRYFYFCRGIDFSFCKLTVIESIWYILRLVFDVNWGIISNCGKCSFPRNWKIVSNWSLMRVFIASYFQICCWFQLVGCICYFEKLDSFYISEWIYELTLSYPSMLECTSRKIRGYFAINTTSVFQNAIVCMNLYVKICCMY